MAKKEFMFRGKRIEELQALGLNEFAAIAPAEFRRKVKRGFTDAEKIFLAKLRKGKDRIETHCRDMLVLPEMVGKTILVHNGKAFKDVLIEPHMICHRLGEFALSRSGVKHSGPGVGATRSSSSMSVR